MDQALDAAAEVFAEVGYEKATTNLIAARAGMSPGSLYQFFTNKEAIAEALAGRYATRQAASHDAAFLRSGAASLPLGTVIGQVIDPMIAFHVANPAARILLQSADLSPALAARTGQLHDAALRRAEDLVAARAPGLSADERARVASVTFQVFKGMLPVILAAGPDERDALIRELKAVLLRYLEPMESGH
jgi:AcrR family transcriptional regulator